MEDHYFGGPTYYGYDLDDGRTGWYTADGAWEGFTLTPTQDEQEQNDAGY